VDVKNLRAKSRKKGRFNHEDTKITKKQTSAGQRGAYSNGAFLALRANILPS